MKEKILDLIEKEFLTPQEYERLMSFLRRVDFPLLPIDKEICRKLKKQADGRLRENLLEIMEGG